MRLTKACAQARRGAEALGRKLAFSSARCGNMLQAAPDAMRRSETIKMHTDLDASQAKASKDLTPHRRQNGMLLYIFGIGPENTETGAPGSRLIYPLSKFGLAWIVLTSLFLMYTGIVTPPLIAFHWTDDECAVIPTLYFDVGLDCFFLADIILTFFTGTFVAGEYIDDFQRGAILYLRGSFLFDCVTSFPVSFFELMAKAACESNTTGEVESGQLRMIRAIKPIRFVKILRIMKVSKAGPLIHMMMDYWNISPKQGKTLKLGTVLIMAIHLMACAWWFFKVLFMTFEEINQFLDDQAWGRHERHSIHTPQGKIEAYIISVYVTTMTITTVGYGDISADNTAERVGYIALFVTGAFVWGNLLASLADIHQAASKRDQEKMEQVQKMLEFLVANDCPRKLRSQIISWTRFSEEHADDNIQKKVVIEKLPSNLQKGLVRHLYARQVSCVPVFAHLEGMDPAEFKDAQRLLDKLFLDLEYCTYAPGDEVVGFDQDADRLIIFVSGRVWVEFEHSYAKISLKEGDYIGDMAILGERDWAKSTCLHLDATHDDENIEISVKVKHEYVVVLQLHAHLFQEAVSQTSMLLQASLQQFREHWATARQQFGRTESLTRSGKPLSLKVLARWEATTKRLRKFNNQATAVAQHSEWNFMVNPLAKRSMSLKQSNKGAQGPCHTTAAPPAQHVSAASWRHHSRGTFRGDVSGDMTVLMGLVQESLTRLQGLQETVDELKASASLSLQVDSSCQMKQGHLSESQGEEDSGALAGAMSVADHAACRTHVTYAQTSRRSQSPLAPVVKAASSMPHVISVTPRGTRPEQNVVEATSPDDALWMASEHRTPMLDAKTPSNKAALRAGAPTLRNLWSPPSWTPHKKKQFVVGGWTNPAHLVSLPDRHPQSLSLAHLRKRVTRGTGCWHHHRRQGRRGSAGGCP